MRRECFNGAALAVGVAVCALALGCTGPDGTQLHGQVRFTILHTPDIHSRLFPYNLQIGHIDSTMGLGEVDTIASVGGAARISHIIGRERARAARVLHLDSGDSFQGAPVFNYFNGEAEFRTLSAMGLDATVIGNHEFDKGPTNLAIQLQQWTNFPAMAANYHFEDPTQPGASPLGGLTQPFTVFDVDGLKVAVFGMGTLSSITSIYDVPNKLGILPLHTTETAQMYIDLLRPLVDLIVVTSHLGLQHDEAMIKGTSGIDIVLGGHNHIALQPPKIVYDCANIDDAGQHFILTNSSKHQDPTEPSDKTRRDCYQRPVVLSHSGAFAKYVGRLDVVVSDVPEDISGTVYDPINRFEVMSNDYRLFPVNETVPEDPTVSWMLEEYAQGLEYSVDLDLLVGYAPEGSLRFAANGGDSPLGNLIATAMWLRLGVQTDFSMTNTTGIRADVVPGPVTVEQMFNLFPFDNAIAKMQLSGREVKDLFDYVARRSAGRGCKSQVQIAGMRLVLDCLSQPDPARPPGEATHIYIGVRQPEQQCTSDTDCPGAQLGSCDVNTQLCWQPIDEIASYEMATSTYLANGGSGYRMLQRNTTQFDTKIQQRDSLIDFVRGGRPCGSGFDGQLEGCRVDADCAGLGEGFVCACPDTVVEGEVCLSDPGRECSFSNEPGPEDGACVLARCRDDVADFLRSTCDKAPTVALREQCRAELPACERGGETCKFLACLDRDLGNFSDGRVMMVGK